MSVPIDRERLEERFHYWCQKLRLTPGWDVKLEWVDDPDWRKTGDFKIDCTDRKAILMLNAANPRQENLEEDIVHELMHLKLYPAAQPEVRLLPRDRRHMTVFLRLSSRRREGVPAQVRALLDQIRQECYDFLYF